MGPVASWVLLLLVCGPSFEKRDTKKQANAPRLTLEPVLFPVMALDLPEGTRWFGAHYLRGFKGLDFPWQLHSMLVEVVHGDGIIPVAQVVLWVGCLFLPPQAAHCQQDSCRESPS